MTDASEESNGRGPLRRAPRLAEPSLFSVADPSELITLARSRARLRGVLAYQTVANTIGVAAVAAYFSFLYPSSTTAGLNTSDVNLVAFGLYVVVMVVLGIPANTLLVRGAAGWVLEGTRPTDLQRRRLFRLPLAQTAGALVSWLGASILFGLVNYRAGRIPIAIFLAGVVTCTLLYLLLEGHFRPVFALALEDADLPADRRDVLPRLMLAWLLGSAAPLAAIGFSPLLSPVPLNGRRLAWIVAACVFGGGLVMGAAARSVARPLGRIRLALKEIEQGNTDTYIPIDDLGELGRLAEGVNDLAAGIREREELREVFRRQVGQAGFADLDMESVGPATPSERRDVTVLFVDLRGYTRFAEANPPEYVVAVLNRFFGVVVSVVSREGGWINKFEGDAALCLFGAPQDQPDHAARALRAAAALPLELAAVPSLPDAGIGVATGAVIAGFIGTTERFEYTVIGDVVNLASRLCDEAKRTRTGVLAAAETYRAAKARSGWRPAGRIPIRGRQARAVVYTVAESPGRRSRRRGTPRASRADRSAP